MEQELFLSALDEAFGQHVTIGEQAAQATNAALWNKAWHAKPLACVSCLSTQDVQQAVRLAAEYAVPVSVLGGGHHWAGFAVVQNGLVLDLRPMSQVRMDRENRSVALGGGSLINDVLLELPGDLAPVTGAVSSVGYAGLTLGGGYGPLNSRFGLACDTMRRAEVVLADGSCVNASAQENADLFWALRGGGGNYGVVTAMELELFSIPRVQAATIVVPLSSAGATLLRMHEIIEAAPDELSIVAGLVTLHDGNKGFFLQPLLSEESQIGERLFDELCSLSDSRVVARRWCSYKEIFDREAEKAWSANQNYRVSARFCEQLDRAVVDLLTHSAQHAPPRAVFSSFTISTERPVESRLKAQLIRSARLTISSRSSQAGTAIRKESLRESGSTKCWTAYRSFRCPAAIRMCLVEKKSSDVTNSTSRPAHDCGQ